MPAQPPDLGESLEWMTSPAYDLRMATVQRLMVILILFIPTGCEEPAVPAQQASLDATEQEARGMSRVQCQTDMLETFSELAVKEPDLMRLTLQACVAAMVNVQSVEAVDAEMKRRAVKGN